MYRITLISQSPRRNFPPSSIHVQNNTPSDASDDQTHQTHQTKPFPSLSSDEISLRARYMHNTSTHRARFPSVITRLHPSSISVRADTRVVNRLHPSSISVRAIHRRNIRQNHLHPSLPDETRMSSSELDLMHFQVYDTDMSSYMS